MENGLQYSTTRDLLHFKQQVYELRSDLVVTDHKTLSCLEMVPLSNIKTVSLQT